MGGLLLPHQQLSPSPWYNRDCNPIPALARKKYKFFLHSFGNFPHMPNNDSNRNVFLLAFFVLVGLGLLHFFPEAGKEVYHDSLIALLAILADRGVKAS